MYHKLKKIPGHFFKWLRKGMLKDLLYISQYIERQDRGRAVIARLADYQIEFNIKKVGAYNINTFLDLMKFRKKKVNRNQYLWDYKGKKLQASELQFIGAYSEYLSGAFDAQYSYNWKNKKVLDIGGFIGDSALYFFEQGAKQVIIYEPIEENVEALNYNLRDYELQIEVYQEAVAQADGPVTLSSQEPLGSLGFGCAEGTYNMTCKGTSLRSILKRHAVDVVKIDCEGGERYLADLSSAEIAAIPYWIVETHHADIYRSVVHHFQKLGFHKLKDLTLSPCVNLLHFTQERES